MTDWLLLADCHLATPVAPTVRSAMDGGVLTPEEGRAAVAALLKAAPESVVFTGGIRGSLQTALSVLSSGYPERKHLVVSAAEGPVWMRMIEGFRRRGYRTTVIPLDAQGRLDPAAIADVLTPETLMVSTTWVAPDTGALHPMADIARLARQNGSFSHSHADNALGYLPTDLQSIPLDLVSFSGNHLYGPERIGGLYVRPDTDLGTFARQECRLYETNHAAEIMGLGEAARLAAERVRHGSELAALRDRLEHAVMRQTAGVRRLGPPGAVRAPHMAGWAFEGINSQALADLLRLQGFRLQTANACEQANPLPPGIEALALPPGYKFGAMTIGLPVDVSTEQIEALAAAIPTCVASLRRRSPVARHLR